ncbi:hypothetical protein H6F42_01935 [Pseudanabaena sp. FACHB-1998]|uniref:hypothetical protein n=1 Tax=Pseudanabaena sp. FACHB-1998 TaxID=2692858 RepID=UPI001680A0EE|nr:hypothetical protein [Pseudanabaena sp. FACHB-1998]MBD2175679.1 hypothetical protein [Pseudanabaena sp. FACHB-1998]
MRIREISKALRKALLQEGSMDTALYQDKLSGHVEEWYEELMADEGSFVFVIAEREENIAMVMIDKDKNILMNEAGREKLAKVWAKNYVKNTKFLISDLADRINEYGLAITGITIKKIPQRTKAIGMGKKSL